MWSSLGEIVDRHFDVAEIDADAVDRHLAFGQVK
jgi:hypothetical protein